MGSWEACSIGKARAEGARNRVDDLVATFLEDEGVPGISFAFARSGDMNFRRAYGFANLETEERLAMDHQFRIASLSKPITAVAIFRLVEEGKLKLADAVFGKEGVLGEVEGKADLTKITVSQLLRHTSGGWTNQKNDPMFQNPRMEHAELIEWTLENRPLENEPGTNYAYYNFGYCLLGRVIEKKTGKSYEDYVREVVLKPAGIEEMSLGSGAKEVEYYQGGKVVRSRSNVKRMDAHGGWVGTPSQMVAFAMRVDGLKEPPDLLQPESLEMMFRPDAVSKGYACGWRVNDQGTAWHGGSLPGLSTILVRTGPKDGHTCWAGFVNTRDNEVYGKLDRLMWKIYRLL